MLSNCTVPCVRGRPALALGELQTTPWFAQAFDTPNGMLTLGLVAEIAKVPSIKTADQDFDLRNSKIRESTLVCQGSCTVRACCHGNLEPFLDPHVLYKPVQ